MAIEKTIEIKVQGKEAEKSLENINNSIKRQKTLTDDQNQATKILSSTVDKYTGGAISGFKSLVGGLKGVAVGFRTVGAAIAATGIGLLVVLLGSLVAAFKTSEDGQNQWAKVMGVVGSIVGNFVDLLASLGEVLIKIFTEPQQTWEKFTGALDKGYQFVKKQVIDRFKANWDILSGAFEAGVLRMRIAWNDFVGDSDKADELRVELDKVNDKVREAVNTIREANGEIVQLYTDASDAVRGFVKELEDEAKAAAKVADMRAKADKIDRKLLVERSELESEIAELKLKSRLEDEFTASQRAQFLKDAQKLEEQLISKEQESLSLKRDAQILENTFARSTKENLDAEAQAIAAVNNANARRINGQRQTQRELNRLNNQVAAQQRQLFEERKKMDEEERKRAADLAKKLAEEREAIIKQIEKLENEYLTSQLDKQTQEENAVREKYFAIIEAARMAGEEIAVLEEAQQAALQEIRDRYEQERLDKLQSFRDKFIEQEELNLEQQREQALSELELLTTTEEEKLQAIAEINEYYRQLQKEKDEEDLENFKILQRAKVDIVANVMGNISDAIGKNAGLGKMAASAQALINTYQGITAELATKTATPFEFGLKLANIASTAAIGFKAVKDINKTKTPGGGGGGASPTGSPDRSRAAFNLIGDRGGVSQIGDLGTQAEPTPQKVYVTTGDVSTGQELDRNAVTQAGF